MTASIYDNCTAECEAMPECARCHRRKQPQGRSAALEAANGYCDSDCEGYYEQPRSGHLWPGELRRMREESEG